MKKHLIVVSLLAAGIAGFTGTSQAAVRTAAAVHTPAASPAPATASVQLDTPASLGCKKSVSDCIADEQALTPLLVARSTNAKLKADIRDAEHPKTESSAGVGQIGLATPLSGRALGSAAAAKEASAQNGERLLQVGGADGVYRAYIDVNGRMVIAETGDVLPDGWRVVSINGSGVQLEKDKKTHNLGI